MSFSTEELDAQLCTFLGAAADLTIAELPGAVGYASDHDWFDMTEVTWGRGGASGVGARAYTCIRTQVLHEDDGLMRAQSSCTWREVTLHPGKTLRQLHADIVLKAACIPKYSGTWHRGCVKLRLC